MAQFVYLKLTIDGNEVPGESTVTSFDRENSIECASFRHSCFIAREAASGSLTARRQMEPVRITKRIDNASPLLWAAMTIPQKVDSAELRFFRTDPVNGGEQQFYTILLEDARIASITNTSEDAITVGDKAPHAMEEVSIVADRITWTFVDGGVTHTDSWKEGAST